MQTTNVFKVHEVGKFAQLPSERRVRLLSTWDPPNVMSDISFSLLCPREYFFRITTLVLFTIISNKVRCISINHLPKCENLETAPQYL